MRLSFGFLLTLESLKDFPLYLLDIKLIYTQNKCDLNKILIDLLFIFDKSLQMGKVFVHLGSGAGDLDSRQNFRCGFTEFIKKNSNSNDKIFCVEANPFNIEKLSECWKNFSNVKIFDRAIVGQNYEGKSLELYYAEDDKPSYQVTSKYKKHVEKHYPESKILSKNVKISRINDFLYEEAKNSTIEYLSIDVEGMEFELISSIDFNRFNIQNISIEFLHLTKKIRKDLLNILIKNGYSFKGKGFDIRGYDLMFQKKMNLILYLKTKFFTPNIKKYI